MNWGIIGTCIGTFFSGISSALQKKQSMEYEDRYIALVYQYSFVVLWTLIFLLISIYQGATEFLPTMNRYQWLIILAISIIGYIGVSCVFHAYKHLSGAVVFIICSISVFLMYFTNIALFPGIETLSYFKIGVASLFFLIIVQFVVHRETDQLGHKQFINKYTLFALGTAVCSTFFNTGSNYLIKTTDIQPLHMLFFSEFTILLIATLCYFIKDKGTRKRMCTTITRRDGISFAMIGLCGAVGGALYYYGYQTNPGNLINFIKLFSIVTGAAMCRIILKDKLTKKQVIWVCFAVMLLIIFLLVK